VQGQADLAGELGERLVVVVAEWRCTVGSANDDEAEQLPRVRDRRHAHDRLVGSPRQHVGEPHPRPRRAGHASACHHGLLFGAEDDLLGATVGHRDGTLEPPTCGAGPYLSDVEAHRLLERLRELQEKLVEWKRASETASERAEHLIGRVSLSVHAAGREVGEPFTGGHPHQRGDRGRQHGQPEQ